MAPKGTQSSLRTEKLPKSKQKTVKLGALPTSTPTRSYDPLTAFSTLPDSSNPRKSSQNISKGKGKAREDVIDLTLESESADDRLWVDIYEPITEADLAVHLRKVEDVRRWFLEAFNGGPSGKLKKYRRILVLTGPAGTAKTATVRILGRELGFDILEWRNSIADSFASYDGELVLQVNEFYETLMAKFEAFLNRVSNCKTFLTPLDRNPASQSSPAASSSHIEQSPRMSDRRIILLEDLPNVLHSATQARLHAILHAAVASPPSDPPVPIVIIISDAQTVGEANDERVAHGRRRNTEVDGVVDIRTVLPRDLLAGPFVTQIRFNPIAPTLLRKALQTLLNTHFASNKSAQPSKEVLDVVVETANGDIRSAIMALQFACVSNNMRSKPRKKKDANMTTVMLESITRREQGLVLFHLLGKVLYNKRKGDLPSSSASAKDIQKEKVQDALIKDPPKLPKWLKDHERKASRVDIDALYASTPIDSSLYSLYIHQNYTNFAVDTEHCDDISDWLSWVDSSGGEAWYQANPYQFHLLTLGTLHSLPTPVPRNNQKIVKPQFFEYLEKEKEAWEAVHNVRNWIIRRTTGQDGNVWRTCGWSAPEVALELGGVLKALDSRQRADRPPRSHSCFSRMAYDNSVSSQWQQLDEAELDISDDVDNDAKFINTNAEEVTGRWLDNDDIEEF
ncbi:Rad17 cell cycle checkpoint domain containing protein [Amanita muscaria]